MTFYIAGPFAIGMDADGNMVYTEACPEDLGITMREGDKDGIDGQ